MLKNKKTIGRLKIFMLMVLDMILFFFSNYAAYYFSSGNTQVFNEYGFTVKNPLHILVISILVVIVNCLFGLYRSVWTFAGQEEIIHGGCAAIVNSGLLLLADRFVFTHIFEQQYVLNISLYILVLVFSIITTIAPRIGYKIIRSRIEFLSRGLNKTSAKRVMIVGAGYTGNLVIQDMFTNQWEKYKPVVAVDDNLAKEHKKLNGIKIAGTCRDIPQIVEKYDVDEIVICIPSAQTDVLNNIYNICINTGKKVKTSPSIQEILDDSTNSSKRLREIDITDLLARDEIHLDVKVCKYLIDTTILVTGGGGSIGSELCKQCAKYNPKTIVIFDIYENCAFELANDLIKKHGDSINIQVRIGSVRDIDRLNEVFEEFHPDVVFHAAAHKHVPLMEDSPCEAVKNNVFGTYNVAVTADKFKVPKMVILSTDKAVNPTNVMGATKRITEIIVQCMNNKSSNTQYAAVRFGNVLGSHGSVIPIFKKQIAQGGPVCVTHPDITRYFMTIPEAAQLVCQAGGLAKGGEVFVLDMGQPVRIMDLAENLIKLSGYTVDEIGIEITGLRPGEKLYEELSMDSELETRQKTANKKIFVNQPMDINEEDFEHMLDDLRNINEKNVRDILQKAVPNYHPANNQ